jgi:hypothetical protein
MHYTSHAVFQDLTVYHCGGSGILMGEAIVDVVIDGCTVRDVGCV